LRRTVLVYGLLGGVLIVALHLIQYRFLVVEYSLEVWPKGRERDRRRP
jgi:hypothetical protein